jgi:hypothetical protein
MKKFEDTDVAGSHNLLQVRRQSNKIYFLKTYAYLHI